MNIQWHQIWNFYFVLWGKPFWQKSNIKLKGISTIKCQHPNGPFWYMVGWKWLVVPFTVPNKVDLTFLNWDQKLSFFYWTTWSPSQKKKEYCEYPLVFVACTWRHTRRRLLLAFEFVFHSFSVVCFSMFRSHCCRFIKRRYFRSLTSFSQIRWRQSASDKTRCRRTKWHKKKKDL